MAYSESLLYAGYQSLNLSQIYMSGIFIGASGAMMDLSVDITSAVNEVIGKKPDIGLEGSGPIRNECRKSRNGNDDNNASAGLFRRLYSTSDDIHGTGNTDRQYPELQICSSRITGHDRWKLRSCDGCTVYCAYQCVAAHKKKSITAPHLCSPDD